MTSKVYLIHLTGPRETQYKIVDHDAFEWLSKPYDSREPYWEDTYVPSSQQKAMLQDGDELPMEICRSSYQNDRAINARPLPPYPVCYSLIDLNAALNQFGGEIVAEWKGYSY